ncbi:MAG: D-sedoheptulose 7-phosphate isomerase [Saprospiraceae bacterium]|nr:D-sedoheptulose 7-phosphate isomerase [Saprospiraceae bacterium]
MIRKKIIESRDVKNAILEDEALISSVESAAYLMIDAFKNDRKVLFCGNGGSAADAQHLAAELSGRFYKNRPALYAEALHVNSSFMTAVANDFGYDHVYSRMVEASGRRGDILVAISTSGNSTNILNAINKAKEIGMKVIGMTGRSGGAMKDHCDILLNVPSNDTPRIQEIHILFGHIICEMIEKELFDDNQF